jgi:dTDP-4-dehydrorhamnose reductase
LVKGVLVFGRQGQVASELRARTWPKGLVATFLGREQCDLRQPGRGRLAIETHRPALVINAAAFTAVDEAETQQVAAYALNAEAPGELAAACAASDIPLLHVSTDYVFDGALGRPYVEDDIVNPLSVYGASKEAGERAVRSLNAQHIILRTAWIFSIHGRNFLKTMLRMAYERRPVLRIVGDQQGCPTPAEAIANVIIELAEGLLDGRRKLGTYHFCGSPSATWHEFACAIFQRASRLGVSVPAEVIKIGTVDYPTPARRPADSRLDCTRLGTVWEIAPADWQAALDRCVTQLVGHSDVVASRGGGDV